MPALKDVVAARKRKKPVPRRDPPAEENPPAVTVEAAGEPPPYSMPAETDDPFPEDCKPAAFAGLLGELIDAVDNHTEASRVGLLLQMLVSFGSVIGRTAHFTTEKTRHHCNLFACIVGNTAKARKGTSWDRVRDVFGTVDEEWFRRRIKGGLSSGEGLIKEVRDRQTKMELREEKGKQSVLVETVVDEGVKDKRLLVIESEFASVLKNFERQGNSLSMAMRQAWEGSIMQSMVKNSPDVATDHHISIIGHITRDELRRYLTSTEAANGLANRFLWCAVKRSKLLPEGGGEPDLTPFYGWIRQAVDFARDVGEMRRDENARELWRDFYFAQHNERPGIVGSLLARSEAQVLRLSCLYALLGRSCIVERSHLESAIALWDYCERSTAFLFGHSTGDGLADEVLSMLKKSRKEGVSRMDLYTLLSRHKNKSDIERAFLVLEKSALAHRKTEKTAGRPKETWYYGPAK